MLWVGNREDYWRKSFVVWENGRNFFFVKVETDAGIYGLGEGGLTWREMAASGCVDHLKPLLVGQDPSRIEYLWQVSGSSVIWSKMI